MPSPIKLSKSDVRRALIWKHFTPAASLAEVFQRLGSVQFDPIAPVGCNHDLVLQSRLEGYKIGDWEDLAYQKRQIYDGWDKQASLIRFEGWPIRRFFYDIHSEHYKAIFDEYPGPVAHILKDLEARGPLMPKECEFQERRPDWKDRWYGPSVTKQVLRALWHSGIVMTSGRRRGQHLYDLAERVVPSQFWVVPKVDRETAVRELFYDRYRAIGFVRPGAPVEVWGFRTYVAERLPAIGGLEAAGRILPIEIEGMAAHATPDFLAHLDEPALDSRVAFIAPLDQILWDRKVVGHLFGFDYIWEIYVPEPKRKWGYYVLPVLHGDRLVARTEFFCRKGHLQMKAWRFESESPSATFFEELESALTRFMDYASATQMTADEGVETKIRKLVSKVGRRPAKRSRNVGRRQAENPPDSPL